MKLYGDLRQSQAGHLAGKADMVTDVALEKPGLSKVTRWVCASIETVTMVRSLAVGLEPLDLGPHCNAHP
jgi:hypothetical protein